MWSISYRRLKLGLGVRPRLNSPASKKATSPSLDYSPFRSSAWRALRALSYRAVLLQEACHSPNQFIEPKGFGEHGIRAKEGYGIQVQSGMLRSRYGEDRYVRSHLPQFANGLYAVLSCHHDVCDHERRQMFSAQSETLGPIFCLTDAMAHTD